MNDRFYNAEVPSHVPGSLVHDFNIFDYETADPFEAAGDLLKKGLPDVFWTRNNGGHWIALGAESVQGVLAAPRVFSSTRLMLPDSQNPAAKSFPPVDTDPPYHKAARGAVAPLFTPQRIAAMNNDIRSLTRELIEPIKHKQECEFIDDFAAPLPGTLFLRLMEMPLEDREKLRLLHKRILNPVHDSHRAVPLQEMWDYIEPYVRERMAHPGNDPISYIAQQEVDGRRFELDEIVKIVGTVLRGGTGTTIGMLAYFARYLADNPAIRENLREHPEGIGRMVEEIIRRFPLSTVARFVINDTVFRGVSMKAGDHVAWSVGMYNFDERKFTNPMAVDIGRSNSGHASFGLGIHACLGQHLARAELRIFAEEWLREIPEFHVKPGAHIGYLKGIMIAYDALPLVIGGKPLASRAAI